MALAKFTEGTSELKRDRKDVNFIEADVMLTSGTIAPGETIASWADRAAFLAWLEATFDTTGVNAKDSPEWNDEDISEEYDYENEVNGVKCAGKFTLKKVNSALISFIETQLRNKEVTLAIVPKDRTGTIMLITGVKLTCKVIGKGNSETSSSIELSYNRRSEFRSNVYKYYDIPAAA